MAPVYAHESMGVNGARVLLDRIDIGPQVVAGDAGRGLNTEDELGGQALGRLDPLPDRSWGKFAEPCEFGL